MKKTLKLYASSRGNRAIVVAQDRSGYWHMTIRTTAEMNNLIKTWKETYDVRFIISEEWFASKPCKDARAVRSDFERNILSMMEAWIN